MSFGKTTAIAAGFVGAFGLGIWTGTLVTHRPAPEAAAVSAPAPTADVSTAPATDGRPVRRPRPAATTGTTGMANADRTTAFKPITSSVDISAPELHRRLQPLLNSGADMNIAADGFHSAEQFATVAHAAQNTSVPFMVLKNRVLTEGDTLVAAIRKSKPDLDAVVEVDRARAEARSDLSQLK